ncbi:hypothetical protein [Streptomyces sp. NPDC051546]|uniref:hypothetical protein n=1 Tax=Streptomyces sp. NPDC051546 TaxID=3365655 RepID=UPI00378F3079
MTTKRHIPTCGHHELRSPLDQEACALALPCTFQEQMQALIPRYGGLTGAVAAVLDVSERTVKRHARGSRIPAGPRLRQRLREMALLATCPMFIAAAEAEAEQQRLRRERKAKLQMLRDGEGR